MNKNLQRYVGRIVSLNKEAFQRIAARAARSGKAVENAFVVAAADFRMSRLICYGADTRIAVCVNEIALV